MKKANLLRNTIFIILFFSSFKICAQSAGDWIWANGITGSANDESESVATDNQGNVYVCGLYNSPTLTIGSNTFNNAGGYDFYVVKYDASGNIIWVKNYGSDENDEARSIATDPAGNIFVTGGSTSMSLTLGDTTIHGQGMFVIKYDGNGNVAWVREAVGSQYSDGISLSTDQLGNIFVAGSFYEAAVMFDLNTFVYPLISGYNSYVVKYDNNGNVQWARASSAESIGSIHTDNAGNLYTALYSRSGNIDFGTGSISNPDFTYSNIFLAKYSASGTLLWARTALGNRDDYVYGLAVDNNHNVYISGNFYGDSLKFGNIKLTATGAETMFITKYDENGNVIWSKTATGLASVDNLCADLLGNVYAAGSFSSATLNVGNISLTNTTSNYLVIFLLKYNSNGDVECGQTISSSTTGFSSGISAAPGGDLYYAGMFTSAIVNFGTTTITHISGFDSYLARFHQHSDFVSLCPPIASASINSGLLANNYQWQVDTGAGYADINDNANYTGTQTSSLQLINIPSLWSGYKYRCVFDGQNSNEYTIKITDSWTGIVNNAWENPLNWSCGVVPDSNTDVTISGAVVQINSNVTIRTLTVNQGANVNVAAGNTLTVLH